MNATIKAKIATLMFFGTGFVFLASLTIDPNGARVVGTILFFLGVTEFISSLWKEK